MYYVSWNKYVNKLSPDLDLKPLKPFNLPAKFKVPKKPHHQPPNKAPAPAPMTPKPQPTPTEPSTSPPKPVPAEKPTFLPFPRLPIELRLKIWRHFYAQAPPQLLPFRLCPADIDHVPHKRKSCFADPHVLVLRQRSIPTILRICSESREVGLRYYKLGFDVVQDVEGSCSHQASAEKNRQGRNIYWDPEKDIVHVELGWAPPKDTIYTWGGMESSCFRDVKHLALDSGSSGWKLATKTMGLSELGGLFILEDPNATSPLTDQQRVKWWEWRVKDWQMDVRRQGVRRKKVEVRVVDDWDEVLGPPVPAGIRLTPKLVRAQSN